MAEQLLINKFLIKIIIIMCILMPTEYSRMSEEDRKFAYQYDAFKENELNELLSKDLQEIKEFQPIVDKIKAWLDSEPDKLFTKKTRYDVLKMKLEMNIIEHDFNRIYAPFYKLKAIKPSHHEVWLG